MSCYVQYIWFTWLIHLSKLCTLQMIIINIIIIPGAIHPNPSQNFFTFHLFNFNLLLLLNFFFFSTFLNQWLRLKVAFCNYQSQPYIRIALGAILSSQSIFIAMVGTKLCSTQVFWLNIVENQVYLWYAYCLNLFGKLRR